MPSITDLINARANARRLQGRREDSWPVRDQSRASLPGLILWLPSWEYLCGQYYRPYYDEEDCYGHPVLVLSPESEEGTVEVLPLTSFGGNDLADKHPHNAHIRNSYLPIFPSNPHPDSSRLLFLDPMWPNLLKNSYVNTATRYEIDRKDLRPYDPYGPDYALSADSYQELIAYCGYRPPAPPPASPPELKPESEQKPEPQPTCKSPLLNRLPPSPERPSPPVDSSTMPPETHAKSLETSRSSPAVIHSIESRVAVSAEGELCIARRVWQACAWKRGNMESSSNSSPHEAESRRSCVTGWVVIVTMSFCVAAYAYYRASSEPVSH